MTTFFHKHDSLALSVYVSKKIHQKKVFKRLWNVAYRLKTLIILVVAFHKIAISTKTNYFGTFWLFFLNCIAFGIIHQNIQTDSLKNEISENFNM